jgi:hypothetical protein
MNSLKSINAPPSTCRFNLSFSVSQASSLDFTSSNSSSSWVFRFTHKSRSPITLSTRSASRFPFSRQTPSRTLSIPRSSPSLVELRVHMSSEAFVASKRVVRFAICSDCSGRTEQDVRWVVTPAPSVPIPTRRMRIGIRRAADGKRVFVCALRFNSA